MMMMMTMMVVMATATAWRRWQQQQNSKVTANRESACYAIDTVLRVLYATSHFILTTRQ